MADLPQHTPTCGIPLSPEGYAVLIIAALLGICPHVSVSAQDSTASEVDRNGEFRRAVDGVRQEALPLGRLHIVSLDSSVAVQSIPDHELPDSVSTQVLRDVTTRILHSLTRQGRLMAVARIDSLSREEATRGWNVYISVDPGPRVVLADIRLMGDGSTRPRTAALLAGVRPGQIAGLRPLGGIRASLRTSGMFSLVGEPTWEILPDSTARLLVPVTPAPPGFFDVTIGLLPGSGPGSGSQLVGSGSMELRNAFGAGRQFDLLLDRRPGQTSHVNAGVSDPFVAGYPIRIDLRFDGLQQDSSWSTRRWSAAAAYRFGISLDDLEVGGRYSREVTRPGQAGLDFSGGVQRIARSEASFWGVEVAVRRVDDLLTPRSGVTLESTLERGFRTYRRRLVESGDTTLNAFRDRRERMHMRMRGYVPIGSVVSIVVGGDMSILSADDVDESDLFRIGGASSLRGYDEDRFQGTTVGRGLVEIRSWFEQRSFASVFFDLGFVDRPSIRDIGPESSWHPGFGFGVQFSAPVGLMNVSYALNGRGGLREGRVHVGVRFGL